MRNYRCLLRKQNIIALSDGVIFGEDIIAIIIYIVGKADTFNSELRITNSELYHK